MTFHKILLMKVQLYKMIPTHYVSKDNHLHVVGRSITIVQHSTTLILFGLMGFHWVKCINPLVSYIFMTTRKLSWPSVVAGTGASRGEN